MSRSLIIVHDGFTDSEFTYALDRCREEDIEAWVATITGNDAIGEKGWKAKHDLLVDNALTIARSHMSYQRGNEPMACGPWDILILPGGVKSIEKVRQSAAVIEMILLHHAAGKIVATMCHGAQLLIEADLCKDRLISGYYSIKKDIENAGGTYANFVATCDNIVSAPHYDYNGKWMQAVITAWKARLTAEQLRKAREWDARV